MLYATWYAQEIVHVDKACGALISVRFPNAPHLLPSGHNAFTQRTLARSSWFEQSPNGLYILLIQHQHNPLDQGERHPAHA